MADEEERGAGVDDGAGVGRRAARALDGGAGVDDGAGVGRRRARESARASPAWAGRRRRQRRGGFEMGRSVKIGAVSGLQ